MASDIDLLIVGAGPAGLMLAAWASQYNITARLIDDKSAKTKGQADGLHSRTLEIIDSFGIVEPFLKQSYKVNEICSWVSSARNAPRAQTLLNDRCVEPRPRQP